MNKKVFLSILMSWLLLTGAYSQTGTLHIETATLSNGMKLVLCEDHAKPEIYGGVCVHAGSKNDPPDATGMAHYFEHIMFKGTDLIGTTDWEAEKVWLDSISYFYDRLHETEDPEKRKEIHHKINALSIIAAEYAIPNEVDVILGKMGGQSINAFTSYDVTCYFNCFPSNQLKKWILTYTERLRNPIFRLFQSELETVYEEKNMYGDDLFYPVLEDVLKQVFGEHPYGRPIIGYTEHLKNPQLSKMQAFFDTYYVGNNMTLILVGDFKTKEVIALAEESFGKLRSGEVPKMAEIKLPEYKGKVEVKRRLTPIKAGLLGYHVGNASHPDNYKINMINALLYNDASTGLVDKLMDENKLYLAMPLHFPLKDHGVFGIAFVPKILGQSMKKAEKLVMGCIDSIKQGKFSDELFAAVKMDYLLDHIQNLENLNNKFELLLQLETQGLTWQNYVEEFELLKNLTKADLVAAANQYLGEDYLFYQTRMGFPKKDKISKPDWEPIVAKNTEAKSPFAEKIENMETIPVKPQVIDFKKDVDIIPLTSGHQLYLSKNPYNDIFTLTINFKYGKLHDRYLEPAIRYLNLQGTETLSYDQFNLAMQKMGAGIYVRTTDNEVEISVSGFEKDFDQILQLCYDKIFNPGNDESKLKMIISDQKMEYRMNKHSAQVWAHAVHEYANFGEKSVYLASLTVKELKSLSGKDLLNSFKKALQYAGYSTFVGNIDSEKVKVSLMENFPLNDHYKSGEFLARERTKYANHQLFYLHRTKFRQSNIYFNLNGEKSKSREDEIVGYCFNQYFGNDMYSLVFQEIRELRSLGYSAWAFYNFMLMNKTTGYLYGFLGTQADKTVEGIEAMRVLMMNLPEKPEKFATAKDALVQKNAANYIDFRKIPANVEYWKYQGFEQDPRLLVREITEKLTLEDVITFYQTYIQNRPITVSLSGNTNSFDKKDLGNFGEVTKLKLKNVMKK